MTRSLQAPQSLNTLRRRQNGRHFPDNIFKCILLNENVWILPKTLLKFVPEVPINNIPAFVQIMVCRRPGNKPLSEPMMASLLMHICITRPQWVKIQAKFWTRKRHFIHGPYKRTVEGLLGVYMLFCWKSTISSTGLTVFMPNWWVQPLYWQLTHWPLGDCIEIFDKQFSH